MEFEVTLFLAIVIFASQTENKFVLKIFTFLLGLILFASIIIKIILRLY